MHHAVAPCSLPLKCTESTGYFLVFFLYNNYEEDSVAKTEQCCEYLHLNKKPKAKFQCGAGHRKGSSEVFLCVLLYILAREVRV